MSGKTHDSKDRSKQFKRHTTKHHVYPTSRFILKKKPGLHTAWHDIFGNGTPEEAMEIVKKWMAESGRLNSGVEILENERKLKAWEMVFGGIDTPLDEVSKIIERDWTFPGVKMVKTNNQRGP